MLSRAREADEFTQSSYLLRRVQEIHDESMSIFREAKAAGDHRTALQALDKAARIIEMLVKLKMQLERGSDMPRGATVVHVTRWLGEDGLAHGDLRLRFYQGILVRVVFRDGDGSAEGLT